VVVSSIGVQLVEGEKLVERIMRKFICTAIAIVCVSQYSPHAQMLHQAPCVKGDMGYIEPNTGNAGGEGDFYFYPRVDMDKREWLGAKVRKELPTVTVHMEDKK
jgi:hypothetical protein